MSSHDYSVAYGLLLVSNRYFHAIRRGDKARPDDCDDRMAVRHPLMGFNSHPLVTADRNKHRDLDVADDEDGKRGTHIWPMCYVL